jgi:hypothetical protein
MEFTKEQKTRIKSIISEHSDNHEKCLLELKQYLVQLQDQFNDDYANIAYTIWQTYANKRST